MEYRILGRSGLRVSRLCFGALTIGPLQAKLPLQIGAEIIRAALNAGVNFIDTAELYRTYPYIREAIRGRENKVIIATKSYSYSYPDMEKSVDKACRQLGRDYIDIFMLHEQTSRLTLKGHSEALRYLSDAKRKGRVRAIGVSTHTVEVVRAAALLEPVDVIHPILNMRGIGIADGSLADMLSAISFAVETGKGIYTMKALGGGHLSPQSPEALSWILAQPGISSVAVGMQSLDEVALNCAIFNGEVAEESLLTKVTARSRKVIVEDWCVGCGCCAVKCPMQAIRVEQGRAVIDSGKCIVCGYCGASCPEFCLKII